MIMIDNIMPILPTENFKYIMKDQNNNIMNKIKSDNKNNSFAEKIKEELEKKSLFIINIII